MAARVRSHAQTSCWAAIWSQVSVGGHARAPHSLMRGDIRGEAVYTLSEELDGLRRTRPVAHLVCVTKLFLACALRCCCSHRAGAQVKAQLDKYVPEAVAAVRGARARMYVRLYERRGDCSLGHTYRAII